MRTTRSSELLLYVYPVLPADSPAIERLANGPPLGLEGGVVSALVEGGLAAAVSEVPAGACEEEPLPDTVERVPVALMRLLVQRDAERLLEQGVERFNQTWSVRGYLAHLSGPWPPYRFGSLDLEAMVAGV